MNSARPRKTQWTWEEWQAGRQARRELSLRVGQPVCRRQESSSDRRLRAAFGGERAPGLGGTKGEAGFTLGELVAVLALLAMLAAAVFPLVQNAMLNNELDECRRHGRDVYVALTAANTEREPLGKEPLPGGAFTNSTELFRYLIEQEHAYGLSYQSLAGCGVPVCLDGYLKPENNMWTVVKEMRDELDDGVPILFTRNLDARSFAWKLSERGPDRRIGLDPEWRTPLGKRGGLMIYKSGTVRGTRAKYLTSRAFFGNCRTDPGPVRYLTPSREVVAGGVRERENLTDQPDRTDRSDDRMPLHSG